MGSKTSSHHHPAEDAHGAGHGAAEETEEQRQDRARSAEVELAWGRRLRLPGAILALCLGAVSLAWLASLGHSAPEMSWTWLLLLLFAFSWALALARGGTADVPEPAAPPAPHH